MIAIICLKISLDVTRGCFLTTGTYHTTHIIEERVMLFDVKIKATVSLLSPGYSGFSRCLGRSKAEHLKVVTATVRAIKRVLVTLITVVFVDSDGTIETTHSSRIFKCILMTACNPNMVDMHFNATHIRLRKNLLLIVLSLLIICRAGISIHRKYVQ